MQNCSFDVSKTSQKKVVISEQKTFGFDYYFSNMQQGVFHGQIDFDGKNFEADSNFLKVVKVDENLFFVKILRKNTYFLPKKVKKIAKNDIFFTFYQNGLIEIEAENKVCFSDFFNIKIVDADVLELKNNFYSVKIFGENEQEKSVVFNSFFEPVFMFESCVVESSENGFKVLTNLHDIAGHGIVEIFNIDDDIKKVDEYAVYMSGEPKQCANQNVLPVYFLECIKAGDFKQAKRCLANCILSKVKVEHLATYFGNFVDILLFDGKTYLEYADGEKHYVQLFSFLVKDGKIQEIY